MQASTYIQGPALIEGFTSITSAAGTTTLTVTSQTKQIVTGSTTQTIQLPDATTLPLGRKFLIINKSSGTVTVNDASASLVATVTGGNQAEVHLRAAGSAAGTWDVLSSGSVSGVVAIANGGTNSGTALNNNRVMQSSGGSIVEAALITGSRLLVSDSNGIPTHSAVTATEAGYLTGATANIQTQLDAKQARSTLTTKGDIYVATASATTARQGVGSDGQQIVADSAATNGIRYKTPLVDNFIKNGDAESVTPITTYADAAGTRPVDGTGGSPNVTTSISSSSPMFDSNSFTLVKDAANRQGQGWAIPFTIPAGQQAKVLQIEIPYIVSSGTFVAGTSSADSDVIVYLYDVTNSALIEPSSIKLLSNSTTLSDKFIANFQTSATGTSYRLIMHVASTSASAYTLKIDDVKVTPSQYVYGTPITDWISYTPTGSWSTNTTYTGKWRRVGDSMEVEGLISLAGAPTSATLTINLPTGYSIDTNKLSGNSTGAYPIVGLLVAADIGSTYYQGYLNFKSTTDLYAYVSNTSSTYNNAAPITQAVPFTFGNTDAVYFSYKVPIVGLSSSTQVSDGYDGRLVALDVGLTSSQAVSTNAVLKYDTIIKDTTASYSTSTGLYTAPSAGMYRISITSLPGANANMYIKVNGVNQGILCTALTSSQNSGTINYYLNAGDTVGIYNNNGGTFAATDGTLGFTNRLNIEKIQAPTTISATETVAAGYTLSANKTPSANAAIDFDTKLYDTHNAVTTGGSGAWKFTAPYAGVYQMCVNCALSAGNQTVDVYKNGSQQKVLTSCDTTVRSGCASMNLLAGDYISANPDGSVTFTSTKNTNIYIYRLK